MPTVVSTAWSGAVPSSKNRLIEDVAALYGWSTDDPALRDRIIRFLDATIKDLNTNLFDFNKVAETGILMVEGQGWVQLGHNGFKITQVYLNHSSNGDEPPLSILPYDHFKRLYSSSTKTGKPFVATLFNLEQDGRVYLYYMPNDSMAADYTVTVEYFIRIPLISELGNENSLLIPQEVENAIVLGAQARLAAHLYGPGHVDVQAAHALAAEALSRCKDSDRKNPGAQIRFRLCDSAWSNRRV